MKTYGVDLTWLWPLTSFKIWEYISISVYTSWSRQRVWGSNLAVLNLSERPFISYNPFLSSTMNHMKDTLVQQVRTLLLACLDCCGKEGTMCERPAIATSNYCTVGMRWGVGEGQMLGSNSPISNASRCGGGMCVNYWGRSRRERYL